MPMAKTVSTRGKVQRKTRLPPQNKTQVVTQMTEEERIAARNKIVEENSGLVGKVINDRFTRAIGKFEYRDLFQYGNEGLITAAEKFDPSRGCRFSTLAYWWIRQSISRAIEDEGDLIRLPVHVHAQQRNVRKAEGALKEKLRRNPSLEEIAQEVRMSKANVRLAYMYLKSTTVWIDQDVRRHDNKKTSGLGEFIPDPAQINPEIWVTAREELRSSMHNITFLRRDAEKLGVSERDKKIFEIVFGLDGSGEHQRLAAVGKPLGLTRERVRQIIEKILRRNAECNGPNMNTKLMKEELARVEELMQLTSST